MEIHKFCKQHIDEIDISKDEKASMLNYYDLYLKEAVLPAFSIKVSGMVQGCAGIRLIDRYVGEVWVCFNHKFLFQHKKTIIVKIKDYIDFMGITFGLKRIQAIIDDNNKIDKRWIRFLGFRYSKKLERGWDIYSIKVKEN